jgi:eukaryotic-like serine/threonine-protein kinase
VRKSLFADWSPDGSQLAVVRQIPGGQVLEYPVGTVLYRTAGAIFTPKVSPRGDLVAFQDASQAEFGPIAVVDTKGQKRTVSRRYYSINGLVWSADGSEIWFAEVDTGVAGSIRATDLKGNVRTIMPYSGLLALMDAAPDGRLLLMNDAFVASMYAGRVGADSETDLYWHDNSIIRDISADGRQILFSEGGASSNTDWATYARGINGSPAVGLGNGLATAFSPDGKWAMVNLIGPPCPLVAYPTRAGNARQLASDTIRHFSGAWLPDGQRIVFVGAEPGHLGRYYVQDSPASQPRAISGENIRFSRYDDKVLPSPDGARVAAVVESQGIQLLPIDRGAPRSIPGTAGFSPIAWCGKGSLLMSRQGEIPVEVVKVDVQSGKQQPWKVLAPANRTALSLLSPVRFAPDCETYAYTAQYDPSTLTVMSGSTASH